MSGTEHHDAVDGAVTEARLDDLLARHRRNIELEFRVCLPGRVVQYDPATQTATIRCEFLAIRIVDGEEVPQPPMLLYGIPVEWPGGTSGYVTTPLAPGDPGKLTVSDRCLSTWLHAGNPQAPIDPINGRAHNLADASFEPGLRPLAEARPPTDPRATVVEGPQVKLGRAATQPVALAPQVQAQLQALARAIEAAPVVSGDGGAAFKAALVSALSAWPTNVAARKTYAE